MRSAATMDAPERLRQAIEYEQRRLGDGIPPVREAALLSLIAAIDRLPDSTTADPQPDLISGHRRPGLGAGLALRLALASRGGASGDARAFDAWAVGFLADCGRVAEADRVLAHVETGFMRLAGDVSGRFDAWVATRATPAGWRERADIDWWAAWSARRAASGPPPEGGDGAESDGAYRRLAGTHLEAMSYQLGYPPEAVLGEITVGIWLGVLRELIAMALPMRDRNEDPTPVSIDALVARLAAGMPVEPAIAHRAVDLLALGREGTGWHAAPPGVAPPPLVRLDGDRVALSIHGLLTEPLFYLTREVRRRGAETYHNVAWHREAVFRRDLYALFGDRRFVTSADRIKLRRKDGNIRTDIDAAVFDRKTGTLGVFELKSQDPFARSAAELSRQRDNVLFANRQVSGVLDWLNRHGGDEILNRLDWTVAKRFRVLKVYPFVLGRYVVHFPDGPEPDRRAAWGTWPQVVRLLEAQPFGPKDANPIASLYARLGRDGSPLPSPAGLPPQEIVLDGTRLIIWPSYAAYRERDG